MKCGALWDYFRSFAANFSDHSVTCQAEQADFEFVSVTAEGYAGCAGYQGATKVVMQRLALLLHFYESPDKTLDTLLGYNNLRVLSCSTLSLTVKPEE